MKKLNMKGREGQKGFTLVELAVVMIIVGLLIGGILKGQELITNAQVASTITQTKGLDAAVSTFRDSYRSFPGDMANPGTRLPNCTANPCNSAHANAGDGRITGIAPGAAAANGSEAVLFFVQLGAAELITGVTNDGTATFGAGLPESAVGGGYYVGYHPGAATLGISAANASGGHWLSLRDAPGGPTAGIGALTASQAARVDAKMDDSDPTSGSVLADNTNSCTNAAGDAYDEASNPQGCNLYIKIQG